MRPTGPGSPDSDCDRVMSVQMLSPLSLPDGLSDMPLSSDLSELNLDGFPSQLDSAGLASCVQLDVLMTLFTNEVRAGLNPSIEAYAQRHKELADDIRELFPLVETLEHCRDRKESEVLRYRFPQEFRIEQLGEYRIVRELGRGGMGIVFEAFEPGMQRPVAIKLLPWRFREDRPQRAEQLRNEAATIARLRHRNIVPIYSFGQHDGYWYYVMQYVAGVSLGWVTRRLREPAGLVTAEEIHRIARSGSFAVKGLVEPMVETTDRTISRDSWMAFARMGVQVAQALAYAHREGALHNDIKPDNLLLDTVGKIFVTDFGVGLHWAEGNSSQDDQPVGTLRYMAPERLDGHPSAATDIYALGVTLYELVTGSSPFDHEDRRQLTELIFEAKPLTPRERRPQLPVALETIIQRAMAKEPSHRYATANELAADLLRFIKRQPIAPTRGSLWDRLLLWRKRPE